MPVSIRIIPERSIRSLDEGMYDSVDISYDSRISHIDASPIWYNDSTQAMPCRSIGAGIQVIAPQGPIAALDKDMDIFWTGWILGCVRELLKSDSNRHNERLPPK
jgi:hypothetical protein